MKGFQLTSGVFLITIGLVSLQTQLTSAAFSMSETCNYLVKGWIADPTSCKSWGYCDGGKLIGTGKCNEGLLFDISTGACNFADDVSCMTSVADVCENLPNPQVIADPNDCRRFCYCDANNATTCGTCPLNQFYNPTTGSCVWSSTYSCPAQSVCRLVPNNKFVGDPYKCGNYLNCLNGAGVSTACNNNQYYNAQTGICQTANICTNSDDNKGPPTVNAGPGVIKALPDDPTKCRGSTGTVAAPQFFSDGQTCMGFYVCDGTAKTGSWSKCPLGTHFDQTAVKCVTPFSVMCNYDRCANINQPFVTISTRTDSTCTSYNYCVNQTVQPNSSGTCPAGYNYFDERAGNCIPTKPNYKICGGT